MNTTISRPVPTGNAYTDTLNVARWEYDFLTLAYPMPMYLRLRGIIDRSNNVDRSGIMTVTPEEMNAYIDGWLLLDDAATKNVS